MKLNKLHYLDILYILLHIVANLSKISLHTLGVLIVDDVYKLAKLVANLSHLCTGVWVEQYLLKQIVVLVEHPFCYTHCLLYTSPRPRDA